jgi:hypothetical protein
MTDLAWAESPLQLLSALEARHRGLLGPAEVRVRTGSDALHATAREVIRLGLPAKTTLTFAEHIGRTGSTWALGDAFSGRAQARMLLDRAPERIVLLDDGLATLHLLGLLCGPWRQPLLRARARPGPARRAFAALAGQRLRGLARQGRVSVFTGLPIPGALLARARRVGIPVLVHDFAWLRTLPAEPPPEQRCVVLGTSLVANGLIEREAYLEWLDKVTGREPVAYYPHRRECPEVLARLREDPAVTLVERDLPVELSLRGLTAGHRVLSLPSTAITSLRVLHGGNGPRIEGVSVPSGWWTEQAAPALRTHLSVSVLGPEFA